MHSAELIKSTYPYYALLASSSIHVYAFTPTTYLLFIQFMVVFFTIIIFIKAKNKF